VKIVGLPGQWSAQSAERVAELVRSAGPAVDDLVRRAQHAGEVALKAIGAGRDAALQSAEQVARDEGADDAADALHSARAATGVLKPEELPIADYDELNLNDAVAAVKDLESPADIRAIIAYEEVHKNRQKLVSAAQTRVAEIAQEVVGLS
jgi:hypothetical protein